MAGTCQGIQLFFSLINTVCYKYKPLADRSEQDKFDIAASLQLATENIVYEYIKGFVEDIKMKNLCLSGGVALNSVMVGKILKELYIDTALKRSDNLDKEHEPEKVEENTGKQLSWKEYKKLNVK